MGLTCRIGMGGYGSWPDAGGLNDQTAWVPDAFALLSEAEAAMDSVQRHSKGND